MVTRFFTFANLTVFISILPKFMLPQPFRIKYPDRIYLRYLRVLIWRAHLSDAHALTPLLLTVQIAVMNGLGQRCWLLIITL